MEGTPRWSNRLETGMKRNRQDNADSPATEVGKGPGVGKMQDDVQLVGGHEIVQQDRRESDMANPPKIEVGETLTGSWKLAALRARMTQHNSTSRLDRLEENPTRRG